MRVSIEQMKHLRDFYAMAKRHPYRTALRRQLAIECCRVLGMDNEQNELVVVEIAKSISLWLVKPEDAIREINKLEMVEHDETN